MFCVSSVATGDYWDPSVPDAANIPMGLEPPEVKFGGSIGRRLRCIDDKKQSVTAEETGWVHTFYSPRSD